MKLIFVRHGEPDYNSDTLTPAGIEEAKALALRIKNMQIDKVYCSPFGRAKQTASYSLKELNQESITLDWIREFSYPIEDPITKRNGVCWDFTPKHLWSDPRLTTPTEWLSVPFINKNKDISNNYDTVIRNFDKLLEGYDYYREDHYYIRKNVTPRFFTSTVDDNNQIRKDYSRSDEEKEPVLVFFCHLGVICLILSHLVNIPFELITHGFFLPTTSLTILNTEERWENQVSFRVQALGDCSHLLSHGVPISPGGSFANPFQY